MSDPIKDLDKHTASESNSENKNEKPLLRKLFKRAGRQLICAQMRYKTASVPEKVVLQVGIQAAFFIPLNNVVGCYLLYDDYKSYKENKTKKPDRIPFVCTTYYNDIALVPTPCRHYAVQKQAPAQDNTYQIDNGKLYLPKSDIN